MRSPATKVWWGRKSVWSWSGRDEEGRTGGQGVKTAPFRGECRGKERREERAVRCVGRDVFLRGKTRRRVYMPVGMTGRGQECGGIRDRGSAGKETSQTGQEGAEERLVSTLSSPRPLSCLLPRLRPSSGVLSRVPAAHPRGASLTESWW